VREREGKREREREEREIEGEKERKRKRERERERERLRESGVNQSYRQKDSMPTKNASVHVCSYARKPDSQKCCCGCDRDDWSWSVIIKTKRVWLNEAHASRES
jgi:hypothetical protein